MKRYKQRKLLYGYWFICLLILFGARELFFFSLLIILASIWIQYRFYATYEPCGLANAARHLQEQKRRKRKRKHHS